MASFLYNPDRKPKEYLIAEFVVRTGIYDEIMHDLDTSKMDHPEQHYLLVGQRGAGKTTLLNRLKYGIEDSKKIKDRVIPILFSEEQYNISELVNLWESIAQYLEDYYGFEGLYEEIEINLNKENFEELSYEILEKHLKRKKKKLILLIDNIGDMLKKMEKTEVHRLRELLQTKSEIRLIVGSPFYLETILDYHQPLFEFFKVMHLDGLNKKETQQLLQKLGEINGEEEKIQKIIKETPERIETLRTLTGGVPRTIALMFKIFIEYNNEDTIKDLEKILDAVTPLYKHRMDDLPTQQQKIVDAVAKNWDGISVKELKEKLRIESKIISAQLRQLEKNQIIDIVETKTKNNIYFLKERFFNIWYLMRYGRKYDKQRVIWLVKFLESWCSANEIEQRIIDYARKIEEGKLDNQMVSFYGEVYVAMENLSSEVKVILKRSTPKYLSNKIKIEDKEILRIASEKFAKKDYENAFELLNDVESPDEVTSHEVLVYLLHLPTNNRKYFLNIIDGILLKAERKRQAIINVFEYFLLIIYIDYGCISLVHSRKYEDAHGALKLLLNFLSEQEYEFENLVNIMVNNTFLFFLKHGQFNVVLKSFEDYPVWKDKLKPSYYATLKIMGIDSELNKMGNELKDKVNEIIKRVSEESIKLR